MTFIFRNPTQRYLWQRGNDSFMILQEYIAMVPPELQPPSFQFDGLIFMRIHFICTVRV